MFQGMNRRDAIGCLTWMGLPALLVGGCIGGCQSMGWKRSISGYIELKEDLKQTANRHYSEPISIPTNNPQHVLEAINRAEKALICTGDLLRIKHPFMSRDYPFLNYYHLAKKAADTMGNIGDTPEYLEARDLAAKLRADLATEVGRCHKYLLRYQSIPEVARDPVATRYLTCCIPLLKVLEKRIRQGKLMVTDNILTHTNKFGRFAELIGQVDHYDEVIAELQALREHLNSKR